jgi:hypothetical protein
MKTSVPFKQNLVKWMLLVCVIASGVTVNAQPVTDLNFDNSSLYSGTDGADGAVYKFPSVSANIDALVTIKGRSSSLVSVHNIDLPSTGFRKAFQPQIKYNNGNVSGAASWWIEFQVQFVTANTNNPAIVENFYATGLDIDGDDNKLKEWDSFYGGSAYTVENSSLLSIATITGTLTQLLLGGRQFTGTITEHAGIDTSATELMATVRYQNTNTMTMRMGATTTGSVNNANRKYSVWFKNFSYNAPFTLPVKLESFTAMLVNKHADLKWVTSSEINVSHFAVEKSTDGKNFTDAGMVFAYGSTSAKVSYNFSDNLSAETSSVVYYRLRSEDIDGKAQYSDTRIIRLAKQTVAGVSILTYPNPVTNELRITIPENWQNKNLVVEVFNANGTTTARKQAANSSQTETINVSALAPGFYIVRVNCNGEIAQQKIIKQ